MAEPTGYIETDVFYFTEGVSGSTRPWLMSTHRPGALAVRVALPEDYSFDSKSKLREVTVKECNSSLVVVAGLVSNTIHVRDAVTERNHYFDRYSGREILGIDGNPVTATDRLVYLMPLFISDYD